MRKIKRITPFLLLLSGITSAQEYKPHPLLSPMWQAETEYFTPSQIEDSTQKNGFTGGAFNLRFPIYRGKDWLDAAGGHPYFAFIANTGVNARQSQINYIEPDRLLTNYKLGITGLMATGPSSLRNLYMLQVTTSSPAQDFRLAPRFHGALIWRRLYHDNRLWHTIGITYTPVFGRDLPMPVIGAGYKINKENQVQFTFPFNFVYTYLLSRQLSISGRLINSGGYYRLQEDIRQEEDYFYRYNYLRAALAVRYITDLNVVWTPEIGLTNKAHVQLDDTKNRQLSAIYFRLGMQVRFGKRPAASPIMNFDPGDSGFDPSYLVE